MCESLKPNHARDEPTGESIVPTFTANIYVGVNNGVSLVLEKMINLSKVRNVCRDYCDKVGLCVTITETEFVYTNGGEPGFVVGLINYHRFPSLPEEIKKHAIALATILKEEFAQRRVSIVCTDETIMIGDEDA